MKTLPLHCLIITIGSTVARLRTHFAAHEIVCASAIMEELVGEDRQDIASDIQRELHHRSTLKLTLGERVVIEASWTRREDRISLAHIGIASGVPVFYFIDSEIDQTLWATVSYDILRGDGIAEVVDTNNTKFHLVQKLPAGDILPILRPQFHGITAIGDIHGMFHSLMNALSWARNRNHFLIFLGDVLDYGRQSLEVVDEVYRLVMRGEAEFILGNHERKIMRWLDGVANGKRINLSDGNRVTTNAIENLSPNERRRWINRFRALVSAGRHHRRIGDFLFVHAGAHDDLWTSTERRLPKILEARAIFGEVEWKPREQQMIRLYNWCDEIPPGHCAIVGHDIRSTMMPITVENKNGGKTVFLDTGCGKGGILSTADIRFVGDDTLNLTNFNTH